MPRVPPPSSGASPAPTAHSTPTRVFLVACQQHGRDHPRCACAAVACDTSRGNVKKGHIQMSSPHNSKCEGSGGLHRPVGGGLVRASPGGCTDMWLSLLSGPPLQREKMECSAGERRQPCKQLSWGGMGNGGRGRRAHIQLLQHARPVTHILPFHPLTHPVR